MVEISNNGSEIWVGKPTVTEKEWYDNVTLGREPKNVFYVSVQKAPYRPPERFIIRHENDGVDIPRTIENLKREVKIFLSDLSPETAETKANQIFSIFGINRRHFADHFVIEGEDESPVQLSGLKFPPDIGQKTTRPELTALFKGAILKIADALLTKHFTPPVEHQEDKDWLPASNLFRRTLQFLAPIVIYDDPNSQEVSALAPGEVRYTPKRLHCRGIHNVSAKELYDQLSFDLEWAVKGHGSLFSEGVHGGACFEVQSDLYLPPEVMTGQGGFLGEQRKVAGTGARLTDYAYTDPNISFVWDQIAGDVSVGFDGNTQFQKDPVFRTPRVLQDEGVSFSVTATDSYGNSDRGMIHYTVTNDINELPRIEYRTTVAKPGESLEFMITIQDQNPDDELKILEIREISEFGIGISYREKNTRGLYQVQLNVPEFEDILEEAGEEIQLDIVYSDGIDDFVENISIPVSFAPELEARDIEAIPAGGIKTFTIELSDRNQGDKLEITNMGYNDSQYRSQLRYTIIPHEDNDRIFSVEVTAPNLGSSGDLAAVDVPLFIEFTDGEHELSSTITIPVIPTSLTPSYADSTEKFLVLEKAAEKTGGKIEMVEYIEGVRSDETILDPILRAYEREEEKKDYQIVLMIDYSGSMSLVADVISKKATQIIDKIISEVPKEGRYELYVFGYGDGKTFPLMSSGPFEVNGENASQERWNTIEELRRRASEASESIKTSFIRVESIWHTLYETTEGDHKLPWRDGDDVTKRVIVLSDYEYEVFDNNVRVRETWTKDEAIESLKQRGIEIWPVLFRNRPYVGLRSRTGGGGI